MNKYILLLLFLITGKIYAYENYDSLQYELDKILSQHKNFEVNKLNAIEKLKMAETTESNKWEKFRLNDKIYKEYRAFKCDSAIRYLNKNIQLLNDIKVNGNKPEKNPINADSCIIDTQLKLAYLLGSTGMYKESHDILNSINRNLLNGKNVEDYYIAYDHLYGEIASYSQEPIQAHKYKELSSLYKDTLYQILDKNNINYISLEENRLRDECKYHESLALSNLRLSKCAPDSPEYAEACFFRAMTYRQMGDVNMMKSYFVRSALADIKASTKDHASLWMLAQVLFEEGNVEKSYKYIRNSWKDTEFYNARLRSMQSAAILSMIDQTYQATIDTQFRKLKMYISIVSMLVILVFGAFIYIWIQKNSLTRTRNKLEISNKELEKVISQLNETNKIKEEYIGRFIKLCSAYINKLDSFRKKVNKKAMNNQVKELYDMTRDQDIVNLEVEELYSNFDKAFLSLFPDFISEFNRLLKPECQILPKKGEILNTELRIYALIRLGINDSNQIAEFLRYSVNTVYNYKAKIRNKSVCSREDLDLLVLKIR